VRQRAYAKNDIHLYYGTVIQSGGKLPWPCDHDAHSSELQRNQPYKPANLVLRRVSLSAKPLESVPVNGFDTR
jgi:hypothetical protein